MGTVSIELRWVIPPGFYGKLFPRSGVRGIIQILILNHHPEKTFTVRTKDRIAQVVFMEKFNANFYRVYNAHLLGRTKRRNDGFGSTGIQVKKKKLKRG